MRQYIYYLQDIRKHGWKISAHECKKKSPIQVGDIMPICCQLCAKVRKKKKAGVVTAELMMTDAIMEAPAAGSATNVFIRWIERFFLQDEVPQQTKS